VTRAPIGFSVAVLLVACNSHAENQQSASAVGPSAPSLRWENGADHTKVARSADADGTRYVYRCWQRQRDFDCLVVSEDRHSEHEARRFQVAALPPHRPELRQSGYMCRPGSAAYPGAMHEEIWNDRGRLTRNISLTQDVNSPTWDQDFVLGYMRDNGLADRVDTYFRCIGVTTALYNGSLASVETTDVDLPAMSAPLARLGGGE